MAQDGRKLPLAEQIASSKAGAWFFINVSSRLDPWVLKKTDGRWSTLPGAQVLLLQHVGAKSGADRETPLVYAVDGDDIILIASKGGAPTNPAWYHNLVANPECGVVARGRTGRYRATELDGDEYAPRVGGRDRGLRRLRRVPGSCRRSPDPAVPPEPGRLTGAPERHPRRRRPSPLAVAGEAV